MFYRVAGLMSNSKFALVVVAGMLALVVAHVKLEVTSSAKTAKLLLHSGHASSNNDPAEPLRETNYVHHIYGGLARNMSSTSVFCDPEQWQSRSWRSESTATGEHLYASQAAQQAIWQHQHPRDCSVRKFLLYAIDGAGEHGIGSTLHVATWALAKAIELDRILLFLPTPEGPWSQGKYCEGHSGLHNCYFEPESSCAFADIMGVLALSQVPNLDDRVPQHDQRLLQCDISYPILDVPLVPAKLRNMLQGSHVPEERSTFWFRSQAIAFIVRPNSRTLNHIRQRKQQQSWTQVPPGTISIHIRHGDKGIEMPLAPDADYLAKAEELVTQDSRLQRIIFLSTEDPASIEYFKHLQNWTILTLQVPRPDVQTSPLDFARQIGTDVEMLNSLVNLDLALECSAWVGTIKSNWNRLIEELRSTVRCKAQYAYIDAHSGWDVSDYGW